MVEEVIRVEGRKVCGLRKDVIQDSVEEGRVPVVIAGLGGVKSLTRLWPKEKLTKILVTAPDVATANQRIARRAEVSGEEVYARIARMEESMKQFKDSEVVLMCHLLSSRFPRPLTTQCHRR